MTRPWQRSGYGITRLVLGLLLLGAAVLKAHQLATEPVAGHGLLGARWFLILGLEVEIVLGLLLVSGLWPRAAWWGALLCFALFAVLTARKAWAGEASCGCFGTVPVDPWYTLVLDVGALTALAMFRPDPRQFGPAPDWRRRSAGMAAVALAIGLPAGLVSGLYEPARLAEDGHVAGSGRAVLLEPETWIGRRCPLLKHVDVGAKLARGRWTVVLYHHDCPRCRERAPRFATGAQERAKRLGIAKTAMLELPPYASPDESLLPPETKCLLGRVSDDRDWFVETPTVLVLTDGAVLDARGGDRAESAAGRELARFRPQRGERAQALSAHGYSFGYVEPESVHKVLLAVPNPSDGPLGIRKVRSECGCMAAAVADEAVPPGEPVLVRVVLVAPKRRTSYHKRILLQTDDPAQKTISIPIKAAVGIALTADPSLIDFGAMTLGERREAFVTVANRGTQPVRLLYSTSSGSGCFAQVPREPVPPGGERAVPVVVTGRRTGSRRVTIQIQTDSKRQPTLALPVRFTVVERRGPALGGQPGKRPLAAAPTGKE